MTKVREICQDALIELGVNGAADAMNAEDAAFALRTLNRMLGKWNNEDLMIYTVNRTEFPLVAGTQVYTLGTGGTFNMPRPTKISMVSVKIAGTYPLEIPLGILTDQDWQNTGIKTTPSRFPTNVWITGDVPLNSLYFWPVPQDSTVKAVIYSWGRTAAFADLNTDVVFPDGYEEALVTNLAVALSNSYGVSVGPALQMRAAAAKGAIQSTNLDPIYMDIDSGLLSGRGNSLAIRSQGLQVDR